jgi:hypothetical protein
MSYANGPRIVTDGLVLYLDAGNSKSYAGSGTDWNDLSGNGNNGTLTNGPTFSSANKGSIVFDGTNDYINCGSGNLINITGTGITLGAWIYRTAVNPTNYYRRVIEKAITYPGLQYSLVTTPSGDAAGEGKLLLDLYLNSALPTPCRGTTQLSLNTWYYISATYDGSSRKLYLNGNLDVQTATTGNITSTASSLIIGEYLPGSGTTYAWNGRIANTQLYNRALTASEIQQNYNATKGRFNL